MRRFFQRAHGWTSTSTPTSSVLAAAGSRPGLFGCGFLKWCIWELTQQHLWSSPGIYLPSLEFPAKLPCLRCENRRGRFQFPFIGIWTRRAILAQRRVAPRDLVGPHAQLWPGPPTLYPALAWTASAWTTRTVSGGFGGLAARLGTSRHSLSRLCGAPARMQGGCCWVLWRFQLCLSLQQLRGSSRGGDFLATSWAKVRAAEEERLLPMAAAALERRPPTPSASFRAPSARADQALPEGIGTDRCLQKNWISDPFWMVRRGRFNSFRWLSRQGQLHWPVEGVRTYRSSHVA